MEFSAINYAAQTLYLVLILSMPPIVVASVVGVLLSLIQAITQLQEQTLTFGVKLLCVILTLMLMAGWLGAELLSFSTDILDNFYLI